MEDKDEVTKTTRKKGYAPTEGDYELSRVTFRQADNGVVVECSYEMTQECKDKMKKDREQGCPYVSDYREPRTTVYEEKADAKAFIMSELDKLWPEG